MERPYLYTLHGSYPEAIAYLQGCHQALMNMGHRADAHGLHSAYAIDIGRFQQFSQWLAEKYSLASGKEAFRRIGEQTDIPSGSVLQLYREFRAEVGSHDGF